MMRRRAPNRFSCINFPSRVEGWLDFYETEGQSARSVNVPWGPLYCVLQQDEQTLTSYCSEELSIFPLTPKKDAKLTDVLFAELPRVRLDQPPKLQNMKTIWETAHPTLQEEPEEDGAEHHIQHNTSLRGALAIANALIITAIGITMFYILKEPISLENRSMWPAWNTLPAFIGTVMYALLGIEYVLPNENKMKRPEHMLGNCGVVNVAVCFITALYTIVGALGYAQYGDDTKGSVTLNLPANEALAKSTQLLTITAIILSTGLINYVPTDIVWRKIQHKIDPKRHNFAQISFRFGMLVLLTAIAVGVPELEPFVGLTGSISGGSLVVIIPAVIDTVFRWPGGFGRMNWILWKNVLVLVFGLLVLGIGTYFSVVDIVAIYEKE